MIEREMSGNPHYDHAIRAQTDAEAAMQSRLAIVWELRTQTIAYVGHDPATAIINDQLDPVIRERLGLPPFENRQIP